MEEVKDTKATPRHLLVPRYQLAPQEWYTKALAWPFYSIDHRVTDNNLNFSGVTDPMTTVMSEGLLFAGNVHNEVQSIAIVPSDKNTFRLKLGDVKTAKIPIRLVTPGGAIDWIVMAGQVEKALNDTDAVLVKVTKDSTANRLLVEFVGGTDIPQLVPVLEENPTPAGYVTVTTVSNGTFGLEMPQYMWEGWRASDGESRISLLGFSPGQSATNSGQELSLAINNATLAEKESLAALLTADNGVYAQGRSIHLLISILDTKKKVETDVSLYLLIDQGDGILITYQIDIPKAALDNNSSLTGTGDTALSYDITEVLKKATRIVSGGPNLLNQDISTFVKVAFDGKKLKLSVLPKPVSRMEDDGTGTLVQKWYLKPATVTILPAAENSVVVGKSAAGTESSLRHIKQIVAAPTDNNFIFGNDWGLSRFLPFLPQSLTPDLLTGFANRDRVLTIDTKALVMAGKNLILDFRNVGKELSFTFQKNADGGASLTIKRHAHLPNGTPKPSMLVDLIKLELELGKTDALTGSLFLDNELRKLLDTFMLGDPSFATVTISHIDENTVIYTGRDQNTITMKGSVFFAGKLVGSVGRRPLTESLLDPSLLQSLIGSVAGMGGDFWAGMKLPDLWVTNSLSYAKGVLEGWKSVASYNRIDLGSTRWNMIPFVDTIAAIKGKPETRAPGFRINGFSNIDNVVIGSGINDVTGTGFTFSWPLSKLGSNTFTIKGTPLFSLPGVSSSSTDNIASRVGKYLVNEAIGTATAALGGTLTQALGVHIISGGSGSDIYKMNANFWGLGLVLEPFDVKFGGVTPEFYDTLNFSGVKQDLHFTIIEVTTENLPGLTSILELIDGQSSSSNNTRDTHIIDVGTNLVIVNDRASNFEGSIVDRIMGTLNLLTAGVNSAIGAIFDLDWMIGGGSLFLATDIENIIGGKGTNTFHFIDNSRIQGSISGGKVVLDYTKADYGSGGSHGGVEVDFAAGAEINLYNNLDGSTKNFLKTFFGSLVPLSASFGSASGVTGNRLGGIPILNELTGALTHGNYAVSGGVKVIGSPYDDILKGNSADNIFVGGGGNDQFDGCDGTDTVSFSYTSDPVTIDLGASGGAKATDGVGSVSTLTNVENLAGGEGDDVLIGDWNPNTFYFTEKSGNDVVYSGEMKELALVSGSTTEFRFAYSPGTPFRFKFGNDTTTEIDNKKSESADEIDEIATAIQKALNDDTSLSGVTVSYIVADEEFNITLPSAPGDSLYIEYQDTLDFSGSSESISIDNSPTVGDWQITIDGKTITAHGFFAEPEEPDSGSFWSNLDAHLAKGLFASSGVQPILADDVLPDNPTLTSTALTEEQVAMILEEAVARWENSSDVSVADLFDDISLLVADLPGLTLGKVEEGTVFVDATAAGQGWFVDDTPQDDAEFPIDLTDGVHAADPDSPVSGQYDLLTVLLHELGHVAGADHCEDQDSLMYAILETGIRKDVPIMDLVALLAGGSVSGQQQGDDTEQSRLIYGLEEFATWSGNFGDKINEAITGLSIPFVGNTLTDVWNVTSQDITDKIIQDIKDPVLTVFAELEEDETVTSAEIVAIDGIEPSMADPREFSATVELATFHNEVSLDFEGSALETLGLDIASGVLQAEPTLLDGAIILEFGFGLAPDGSFFISNPQVTASVSVDHAESFNLPCRVGSLGAGIVGGNLSLNAELLIAASGRMTVDMLTGEGSGDLIDSPVIGPNSNYEIYLPVVPRGAVEGVQSEAALIKGSFNTEENPGTLPEEAGPADFFDSISYNLTPLNFNELIDMQGISLDSVLNGIKDALTTLMQPDGIGYKKMPIIDKSLVELLGPGGVDFVESLTDMIDTIQETLSDMQSLERDINFGVAEIFNLDLGVTEAEVESAYQLLTAVAFNLSGNSTDEEIALAMAGTLAEFHNLIRERDLVAGYDLLTGLGLDADATDGEIAMSLLSATDEFVFKSLQVDRDLLAANADYQAAVDRLARYQLSGYSTDLEIEAVFDTGEQKDFAQEAIDLLRNPPEDTEQFLLNFARNFLNSKGLTQDSSAADIDAAFRNNDQIAALKADRDLVYNMDPAVIEADTSLSNYGLTGNSDDDAIAKVVVDQDAFIQAKAARDLLLNGDEDIETVEPHLTGEGFSGASTDLEIALAVIDADEFEARKQNRDTLAEYDDNKIITLIYNRSVLTVKFTFEKRLEQEFAFELDLQDLISQPGVPDVVKDLIGDGGLLSFDLDAAGALKFEAFAGFELGFGFDLSNLLSPKFFVLDDTGIYLGLEITTVQPLDFKAEIKLFDSIGLALAVEDGNAELSLGARLGLADDSAGDNQYLITELGLDIIDFDVQGSVSIDLPLYSPTPYIPISGTTADRNNDGYGDNVLHIDTGFSLEGGFKGLNIITPNFASGFSLFALLNDPMFIIDGLNGLFDGMGGVADFFGDLDLPLVGDAMHDASGFIDDLQELIVGDDDESTPEITGLHAAFAPGIAEGKTTIEIIQDVLYDQLGSMLVKESYDQASGRYVYTPVSGPEEIPLVVADDYVNFKLLIKGTVFEETVPIDFDLAVPGVGLKVDSDIVVKLDYLFAFGFGISTTEGLYLDTSGSARGEEISLDLSVSFTEEDGTPATVDGELAFLTLQIIDLMKNDERDTDGLPSGMFGSLDIDLQGGENGRLGVTNIADDLAIEIRMWAGVDLDFDMEIGIGNNSSIAGFSTLFHYKQDLAIIVWNSKTSTQVTLGGSPDILLEDAVLQIAGFVELSARYITYDRIDDNKTVLGATGVTAFMGIDDIGVQLTNGEFGIVFLKQPAAEGETFTRSFAMSALGDVALVGLDGLQISGTVGVKVNNTGGAVSETIQVGSESVPVTFADTEGNIMKFSGSGITMSVAGIFSMTADINFSRMATGRVLVDVPRMSMSIVIDETDVFGISGQAKFTIDPIEGFKLQNILMTGFTIMGVEASAEPRTAPDQGGSTGGGGGLPPPAKPYAELSTPLAGDSVDLTLLNTRKYFDVTYIDPSGSGIDEGSIIDDGTEFTLSGTSVTIPQQTPQKLGGNTYRYRFDGSFTAGNVSVNFIADSFKNTSAIPVWNETATVAFTIRDARADAIENGEPQSMGAGPVIFQGPTVGLKGFKFVSKRDIDGDGIKESAPQLLISIGVGVTKAGLNFGASTKSTGTQSSGTQSSSGIRAELLNVNGVFDVALDLKADFANYILTEPWNAIAGLSAKFVLDVETFIVEVPQVFIGTAAGIRIQFDPNKMQKLGENAGLTFAAGTATASLNDHGFSAGDTIRVTGDSGAGLQYTGFYTVDTAGTDSFTFAATNLSAGPVNGRVIAAYEVDISHSGETATFTKAGLDLQVGDRIVIQVSGDSDSPYNGERLIKTVSESGDTYTFKQSVDPILEQLTVAETGFGDGQQITVSSIGGDDSTDDTVQSVWNNATSGTFTLTFDGQTTGNLAFRMELDTALRHRIVDQQ